MSRIEVEELLGISGAGSRGSDSFELRLQIERGILDPMEGFEPYFASPSENMTKRHCHSSEKVTIVLDPNKGIYSLDEINTT